MIITIISFSVTVFTPGQPSWVEDILRKAPSGPVRSALRENRTNAVVANKSFENKRLGTVQANGDLTLDSSFLQATKDTEEMSRRVSILLDSGQYEAAYREADRFWVHYPEALESYAPEIISTALFTGRYKEAEQLCVLLLRQPGHDFTQNYLELSIASAMQGALYPGQAAYAGEALQRAYRENGADPNATKAFDSPRTSQETALASIVAMGMKTGGAYSMGYYAWALRLDPQCVPAARPLFDLLVERHRDSEAARLAVRMVKILPPGSSRDVFADRLKGLQKTPNPAKR